MKGGVFLLKFSIDTRISGGAVGKEQILTLKLLPGRCHAVVNLSDPRSIGL